MNILSIKGLLRRGSAGLLSLLLVMSASPAFSARVSGLYGAEVPVEGQEAEQRNQAIVEAFRRVLVKVTGSRDIIHHPQLAPEIRQAPRYVRQYRYRMAVVETPPASPAGPEPESGEPPGPSAPALPKPVRMLRVLFDEKAVNRMLRQHGVAVWGSRRPATLVWLATERDGRRNLVAPEADEQLYTTLLDAMERRGIPILFPLMDLEDRTRLRVSDLWGGFSDTIWQASARYGPDAVITARLVAFGPELWRAGWTLLLDKETFLWDSEGESLAMAVETGIHAGMDLLAAHYAPSATGNSAGVITLRVAGVDDLYRFARLQRYLSEQDAVEQLSLVLVEPEAVTYALRVRGGQRALEQGFALSRMLTPDRPEETADPRSPPARPEPVADREETLLRYRLRP